MSDETWTGVQIGTVVRTVGTTVTLYQPSLPLLLVAGTWTA